MLFNMPHMNLWTHFKMCAFLLFLQWCIFSSPFLPYCSLNCPGFLHALLQLAFYMSADVTVNDVLLQSKTFPGVWTLQYTCASSCNFDLNHFWYPKCWYKAWGIPEMESSAMLDWNKTCTLRYIYHWRCITNHWAWMITHHWADIVQRMCFFK